MSSDKFFLTLELLKGSMGSRMVGSGTRQDRARDLVADAHAVATEVEATVETSAHERLANDDFRVTLAPTAQLQTTRNRMLGDPNEGVRDEIAALRAELSRANERLNKSEAEVKEVTRERDQLKSTLMALHMRAERALTVLGRVNPNDNLSQMVERFVAWLEAKAERESNRKPRGASNGKGRQRSARA